jgi:hypothetical protein
LPRAGFGRTSVFYRRSLPAASVQHFQGGS